MNEDYLWDRTGEPDTQIQELEEILGTLRYQPRPLAIPAQLVTVPKRKFFRGFIPPVAIAATIAVMLLGLGVWSFWQRPQTSHVAKRVSREPSVSPSVDPITRNANGNFNGAPTDNSDQNIVSKRAGDEGNRLTKHRNNTVGHSMSARHVIHANQPVLNTPESAISEIQEAESAKVQLMLALRVASSKLNFAQKKTQSTNSENMIHNQHKTG